MKKPRIVILTLYICLLFASFTHAQSDLVPEDEMLMYGRRSSAHSGAIISISRDQSLSFSYDTDLNCTSVSTEGSYAARSSVENVALEVYRLDTNEIVSRIPWRDEWKTCSMHFTQDNQLIISDALTDNVQHAFYIEDSTLIEGTIAQIPEAQPYAILPNWHNEDVTYWSPNEQYVLYEKCSLDSLSETEPACTGITSFVLYDVLAEEEIINPDNQSANIIRGYDELSGFFVSQPGIDWSANSRFLAYASYTNNPFYEPIKFSVYDTVSRSFLDTDFFNETIDYVDSIMQWSPTQNYLNFWINGPLGEDTVDDIQANNRKHPIIYNANTQSFVYPDEPFDIKSGEVIWSPSGESYAFVDDKNRLILIEAATGDSFIIDTNVWGIVTWKTVTEMASNDA